MVTKRNAKTIKKVVRKLKKASKAHAGQAKVEQDCQEKAEVTHGKAGN